MHPRGRRDYSVSEAAFKSSAPFAPPELPSIAIATPMPILELPLPDQDSRSQTRANQGPMKSLQAPRRSEFAEKRKMFCRRFVGNEWNHPSESEALLSKEFAQEKALVIAIHYGRPDPLPATYVDAYNIIDMLENQFGYQPKCIRVLADLVDPDNNKDARWPNKENIINSIEWLNRASISGSRRFLFFAGHGYTSRFHLGENDYPAEGILPRDYLTIVPFEDSNNPEPKEEVVDRKTVLLDCELNKCLVGGLAGGAKLTVIFDCCHSGGLSVSTPEFQDMSHLRSRHLFARQPFSEPANGARNELYVPPGNLLDLPVNVELDTCKIIESLPRSDETQETTTLGNTLDKHFQPFPENCQVVSCHLENQAFIEGIKQPDSTTTTTYRQLNKYIRSEFDKHNKKVDEINSTENANEASSDKESTVIRNSQNGDITDDFQYQYPKLYVSTSMATDFADKMVEI